MVNAALSANPVAQLSRIPSVRLALELGHMHLRVRAAIAAVVTGLLTRSLADAICGEAEQPDAGCARSETIAKALRVSAEFGTASFHATADCWIEGVGWCPIEPQLSDSSAPLGASRGDELCVGVVACPSPAQLCDVAVIRPHFGREGRIFASLARAGAAASLDRMQFGTLLADALGLGGSAAASSQRDVLARRALAVMGKREDDSVSADDLRALAEGPAGRLLARLVAWRLCEQSASLLWAASLSPARLSDSADPAGIDCVTRTRVACEEPQVRTANPLVFLESECVRNRRL